MTPASRSLRRPRPRTGPLERLFLMILALILSTGCATSDVYTQWQTDCETWFTQHGPDANPLRHYPQLAATHDDRPALLRFATLDASADFGHTYDALGVLVGFPRIHTDHWYIFLVAKVRVPTAAAYPETPDSVTEIRPIALRRHPNRFEWILGPPNPDATRQYVQSKLAAPSQYAAHMLFPGRTDVFSLAVADSTVQITEHASNTQWTLAIAPE